MTSIITDSIVFNILKPRDDNTHKGSYGTVTCVCGSRSFPGAAALSVTAALRCGAGIVRLASCGYVASLTAAKVSEPIYLILDETENGAIDGAKAVQNSELAEALEKSSAVLCGCGLTQSDGLFEMVQHIIGNTNGQLILDADALNLIAAKDYDAADILRQAKQPPVLTPHMGEMSRLCGVPIQELKKEPEKYAVMYARMWNSVVVLKDHRTCVAAPDGRCAVNSTGNSGLARGGSGDTLAGMISSPSTTVL